MKPDIKVSTVDGCRVALTTPAEDREDVRVALMLEPLDAVQLGVSLIKHGAAVLQVQVEGKGH